MAASPVKNEAQGIRVSWNGSRGLTRGEKGPLDSRQSSIPPRTHLENPVRMRGFSTSTSARRPSPSFLRSQRSTVDSRRRRPDRDTPAQTCPPLDQEAAITSVNSARQAYRTAGSGWQHDRGSGPPWPRGHSHCSQVVDGALMIVAHLAGTPRGGRADHRAGVEQFSAASGRWIDRNYIRWQLMTGQVLTIRHGHGSGYFELSGLQTMAKTTNLAVSLHCQAAHSNTRARRRLATNLTTQSTWSEILKAQATAPAISGYDTLALSPGRRNTPFNPADITATRERSDEGEEPIQLFRTRAANLRPGSDTTKRRCAIPIFPCAPEWRYVRLEFQHRRVAAIRNLVRSTCHHYVGRAATSL